MTQLMKQDAQENQHRDDDGVQGAAGPTMNAVQVSDAAEEQEKSGVDADVNASDPRDFKGPSHELLKGSPREAYRNTGLIKGGHP
jgi:hypothetical protein